MVGDAIEGKKIFQSLLHMSNHGSFFIYEKGSGTIVAEHDTILVYVFNGRSKNALL